MLPHSAGLKCPAFFHFTMVDKAPGQLETENLTAPVTDGQPEQAAPAEESKGEPEKLMEKSLILPAKWRRAMTPRIR